MKGILYTYIISYEEFAPVIMDFERSHGLTLEAEGPGEPKVSVIQESACMMGIPKSLYFEHF